MIAVVNFYAGLGVGALLVLVAQAWWKGYQEECEERDVPMFVRHDGWTL